MTAGGATRKLSHLLVTTTTTSSSSSSGLPLRRLAIATIASISALDLILERPNDDENDEYVQKQQHGGSWHRQLPSSTSTLDLFSPRTTLLEAPTNYAQSSSSSATTTTKSGSKAVVSDVSTSEVDFVVVGNGNAGNQAVKTLRQLCPSAKIAIVDPLRPFEVSSPSSSAAAVASSNKVIQHWPGQVTSLDTVHRTVDVQSSSSSSTISHGRRSNAAHESTSTVRLRYKHAILLATGVRGAPPPESLLDQSAMDRMLELRPTDCFFGSRHHVGRRPILPPATTRRIALMASRTDDTKVAVLGSSWEAAELAVATKGVLILGSAGPMSHILPRYLCVAVTKRLKQMGIRVEERAMVRYIAQKQEYYLPKHSGTPQLPRNRLEVHTGKSYDSLDTARSLVDLVVVAPHVDGARGTAVMPMAEPPRALLLEQDDDSVSPSTPWYQSWAQMATTTSSLTTDEGEDYAFHLTTSPIVCYADDGRVAVNAELMAASGVFAAGSVAKYPNSETGAAQVAGEGSVDGARAGHVAATNMAQQYYQHASHGFGSAVTAAAATAALPNFASKSLPVWRSDLCSYLQGEEAQSSHLKHVGIHALCVGMCDSERLATHGYWWTNHGGNSTSLLLNEHKNGTSKRKHQHAHSVYGNGVVYYFDRTGRIRGIMLWGLPFTNGRKSTDINEVLVDRMKEVIATNGKVCMRDPTTELLESSHLAVESKRLAREALSYGNSTLSKNHKRRSIIDMPKPLHRFTPAKPSIIASYGKLRRKDHAEGDELLGEGLYMKSNNVDEMLEDNRPASLIYVYPWQDHSRQLFADQEQASSMSSKDPYRRSMQEKLYEAWQENERRARPPKEEPLWLRRTELGRTSNAKEAMIDVWMSHMQRGAFADGSDAIRRMQPESLAYRGSKRRSSASSNGGGGGGAGFRDWVQSGFSNNGGTVDSGDKVDDGHHESEESEDTERSTS